MAFIGKALLSGASKYVGKAIRLGSYVGKAIPQISKALTQVQRLASTSAVQQAGKSIGIGPSVFNRVGQIAGTANTVIGQVPGVAADVRAGLTAASASLTPARRSIGELYQRANGGN
jgi:hypothetical protein